MNLTRRAFGANVTAAMAVAAATSTASPAAPAPLVIGGRRELFVDRAVVDQARGVDFQLATPVDAGPAIRFDQPWEGSFCAYTTILQEPGLYRMYYRGVPTAGNDGHPAESTCYH